MPFVIAVVILIIVLLFSAINVLNEYERAVVFTLGRFTGIKGPGLVLIYPVVQRMRKVDLRVIVLSVPKQDVITRDNVSVKVNAVVYFRIVDPGKAIIQVANAFEATSQVAQTTLRSVVGEAGRGRAHPPCQDHQRRGREAGGRHAGRGGAPALDPAKRPAASLSADPRRHRARAHAADRLSATAGPDQAAARPAR